MGLSRKDKIMNDDKNRSSDGSKLSDSDYLNNLANETGELFNVDNSETNVGYSDEVDSIVRTSEYDSYNENQDSYSIDNKIRFRLNKGFLFIGLAMILLVPLIVGYNKQERPSTKNRDEAISTDIRETVDDLVSSTSATITFEEESETQSDADDAMKDKHLTNIPVVVTAEVDAYFKDTVYYLKSAMKVDRFIATNELYRNVEMCETYHKLVSDFNDELERWKSHKVPADCKDYDIMIDKSLKAYQYYFTEVLAACDLETEEAYRNKLQAAVAYVQATVDYSTTAEDYSPVFYYYGLYE